jgi:hypothetical protein
MASALVRGRFSRALIEPLGAEVRVDGCPIGNERPNVVLATTVADVGLGLRVGYRLGQQPRRFHALALRAAGRHLWMSLVPALLGRPGPAPSVADRLATRMEARFDGDEHCLLDGEMFRASEVDVELGPAIRFERP